MDTQGAERIIRDQETTGLACSSSVRIVRDEELPPDSRKKQGWTALKVSGNTNLPQLDFNILDSKTRRKSRLF